MEANQVEKDTIPFDTSEYEPGRRTPPAPQSEPQTEPQNAQQNAENVREPQISFQRVELPKYMEEEKERVLRPETSRTRDNPLPGRLEPIIIRHNLNQSFHRTQSQPEQHVYKMNSRPKGLFLCINNIEFDGNRQNRREGAVKDERNLTTLFYKLGYRVHSFRNQDSQSMKNKIIQFAGRPELSLVDSVVVAVMSHGMGSAYRDTQVMGTDNIPVYCQWIIEQFNVANCPAMQYKPKIFLFQLCRGDKADFVQLPPPPKIAEDGQLMSDVHKLNVDIFIAHATVQGYSAYRHVELGSWFVQAVCHTYMHYACSRSLEEMHKIVNKQLSSCMSDDPTNPSMQTSCYDNRDFDNFYFFPGVYN